VEAATRVFSAKGYRRTLMADVAAELGLSAATLYRTVDSKEALFHLILDDSWRDSPEAVRRPLRKPGPGETVALVRSRMAKDTTLPLL
jgi:AcrR family transcriptional regulator